MSFLTIRLCYFFGEDKLNFKKLSGQRNDLNTVKHTTYNKLYSLTDFHNFFEHSKLALKLSNSLTQPAFTGSMLTIETLEQGVKCVQS